MHWRNSNFQIRNFLAGKCHTADEAHRMLCELYEERDVAIKNAEATDLRTQAKVLRAELAVRDSTTEADKLEAKADLVEVNAFKIQGMAVLAQAIRERDYIQSLLDEVQPFRKYGHLPDEEAHQLIQEEEWKIELMWRAENFLTSQGTIPHDHLSTMRLHPSFEAELMPYVQQLSNKLESRQSKLEMHKTPLTLEVLPDEE